MNIISALFIKLFVYFFKSAFHNLVSFAMIVSSS